jgi:hypothetical protein
MFSSSMLYYYLDLFTRISVKLITLNEEPKLTIIASHIIFFKVTTSSIKCITSQTCSCIQNSVEFSAEAAL